MKLKVYGWQAHRNECETVHRQTREIVAAKSKAEAARLAGSTVTRMFNLAETGNVREIEVALSQPGRIFWAPLSGPRPEYRPAPDGSEARPAK